MRDALYPTRRVAGRKTLHQFVVDAFLALEASLAKLIGGACASSAVACADAAMTGC
jgi:hypothetical protein